MSLIGSIVLAVGGVLGAELFGRVYVRSLYKKRTGREAPFFLYPEEWSIAVPKICRYQSHPYIIYTKRPDTRGLSPVGAFASNNFGFEGTRSVEKKKPAGTFRIICLGGSNTEDNRDDVPDRTYPDFLEQELNKHFNSRIEVLNAGNSGYTSIESMNNFALRLLDFEPDMVVYYEAINDVYFAAMFDGFRSDYAHARKNVPFRPGFLNQLPCWRWSFCYSWVRTKLIRRFAMTRGLIEHINFYPVRPARHDEPRAAATYKRNLKSLCAIALTHGITPVLVPFSYNPQLCTTLASRVLKAYRMENCQDRMVACLDRNNAVLPEISKELNGVVYLPVAPLEDKFFVPQDDCHLTTNGMRELASRIAIQLIPEVEARMKAKPLAPRMSGGGV